MATEHDVERWRDRGPAIWAEFFWKPVEDKKASAAAGRVIFKDEAWVNIHKRGQLGHVIPMSVKMCQTYQDIWPAVANAYNAWVDGEAEPVEGTSLKTVPFISASQVANCAAVHVHTLEQLCNLPDGACGAMGPGTLDLRNKARAYLSAANDVGKTAARVAELEEENETLKERLDRMEKILAKMDDDAPRRRRRRADVIEDDFAQNANDL